MTYLSPKHILWPITDCSSLYATGVTRIQSVVLHHVLRRIGGRGHFRSRDKDGGHTIRSAMADNPILYTNFTTLSFTEPELLPIEVLHGRNIGISRFLRKIVKIINFFYSHSKYDVSVTETHFMTHYRLFYLVCYWSWNEMKSAMI